MTWSNRMSSWPSAVASPSGCVCATKNAFDQSTALSRWGPSLLKIALTELVDVESLVPVAVVLCEFKTSWRSLLVGLKCSPPPLRVEKAAASMRGNERPYRLRLSCYKRSRLPCLSSCCCTAILKNFRTSLFATSCRLHLSRVLERV